MKKWLTIFLFFSYSASAQSFSINTDGSIADTSAILDIKSTAKGMLISRMNKTQRNLIYQPKAGLLIFQTGSDSTGFHYYDGSKWTWVIGSPVLDSSAWLNKGNTATNPVTHFLGTKDNQPLRLRLNNTWAGELNSSNGNYFIGDSAGLFNTTGFNNTAFGSHSLMRNTYRTMNTAIGAYALAVNDTGYSNTAVGAYALSSNKKGEWNTAIGTEALQNNTTGTYNTALGTSALKINTTGFFNTALGVASLYNNTTGAHNVATGIYALYSNTTGSLNTAVGNQSLQINTTGTRNTAIGYSSLFVNSTGSYNTAAGASALLANETGSENAALGAYALRNNTTGSWNTAVGSYALPDNTTGTGNMALGHRVLNVNTIGNDNTGSGFFALVTNTTGNRNTAHGAYALYQNVTGSDNTAIGWSAGTSSSFNNTISIGNGSYLNGFHNQAMIGNLSTAWNGGNVGWSTFSDARVKTNIRDDVKGLDFITRLRPVTYYRSIKAMRELTGNKDTEDYPQKYDIEKIKFSGFLAQDVEKAAKEAGYDFNGITVPRKENELYTLSYESFVIPLVKAVQEQQAIIEKLQQRIDQLEKKLVSLEKTIR